MRKLTQNNYKSGSESLDSRGPIRLHILALPALPTFFFLFWLPRGIWSSQATDQILATVVICTAAMATLYL